jgi:hypothetical protein
MGERAQKVREFRKETTNKGPPSCLRKVEYFVEKGM